MCEEVKENSEKRKRGLKKDSRGNDRVTRYKMFRNFMCNELGITKEDIKAWTKESVATEMGKLVDQINFKGMAEDAVNRRLSGMDLGSARVLDDVKKEVASQIIRGFYRKE